MFKRQPNHNPHKTLFDHSPQFSMATQSAFPFDDHFNSRTSNQHNHHRSGPEVNFDLNTAASLGDLKLVQNLLQNPNINVDIRNGSGWTPLMYAAHYGHYNVIRLLLQHGANVSLQESDGGKTALMLAASNGHTRCIETLVCQGGADIGQRDYSGNCASYYATHYGHGGNKIIARLLAIRQLPGHNNCHSPPSCLHSSGNTSGYKSASSQLHFGQHSPLSPVYHHESDRHSSQSSMGIVTNGAAHVNMANGNHGNQRSNVRSPKSTPRPIFKSPNAYNQRRASNGSCSSSSVGSIMQATSGTNGSIGANTVNVSSANTNNNTNAIGNTTDPLTGNGEFNTNTESNMNMGADTTDNGASLYKSAKNTGSVSSFEQTGLRLIDCDAINEDASIAPFSPGQFLTNNMERNSPLCSTPQSNLTNGTFSTETNGENNCNGGANAVDNNNIMNGFSIKKLQSLARQMTNDVIINAPETECNGNFDFVIDADAFNTRRNLLLPNTAPMSSTSGGLGARRCRPFDSLNGPFHSQMDRNTLNHMNGSDHPPTMDGNGTSGRFSLPSSADLPVNISAMLQNLRLTQYSSLFRDRRVSLLVFLQMTDTELLAIGVSDRSHIGQLLDEQTRIRHLLFGPSRDEVQRFHHQLTLLNQEHKSLQNAFKRLLDQLTRVCEHLDQVEEQIMSLNRNTNELRTMF